MHDESRILTVKEIEQLAESALRGCGANGLQLETAAHSIVDAECDGIRTVGLNYLPIYCGHLIHGKVDGNANPVHRQIAPAVIEVDADHGFAHAAYVVAEADLYNLARQQGIAALSVKQSYSAGVLGWFVQRMAQSGLLGLAFANSPSAVAPAPGAQPFFGTNPFAFAVPRPGGEPIIADMATSQVALVTIKDYAAQGKSIPLGWGYDASGDLTEDGRAVLDGGSLAPLGGYKGMLLALLVDVLAGVIAGPNCSFQAPMFRNNEGGQPDVGQFFIALDPGRFSSSGAHGYAERLEAMLGALSGEPGVRLPGRRRHEFRQRAMSEGIAVPTVLIDKLEKFALEGG